jgi:hypothetical protein
MSAPGTHRLENSGRPLIPKRVMRALLEQHSPVKVSRSVFLGEGARVGTPSNSECRCVSCVCLLQGSAYTTIAAPVGGLLAFANVAMPPTWNEPRFVATAMYCLPST